jgi:uncharacterized protein YycO
MLIALHKGKGWIGKVIQWQTRSPYSHASVLLEDGSVVESREFKGVRHVASAVAFAGEAVDFFRLWNVTQRQEIAIEHRLMAQVGKKYDYLAVARFLTRRDAEDVGRQQWFCSELVFWACLKEGVQLLSRVRPWAVSPGLLALSPNLVKADNGDRTGVNRGN